MTDLVAYFDAHWVVNRYWWVEDEISLMADHWLTKCLIIGALWRHMVTKIWVNIGSRNGLLPDGTKQLPDPMLTYHQ